MKGTLALSWGPWGGFYANRGYGWRVCAGWVALTYVPIEIDDLAKAYVTAKTYQLETKRIRAHVALLREQRDFWIKEAERLANEDKGES